MPPMTYGNVSVKYVLLDLQILDLELIHCK